MTSDSARLLNAFGVRAVVGVMIFVLVGEESIAVALLLVAAGLFTAAGRYAISPAQR